MKTEKQGQVSSPTQMGPRAEHMVRPEVYTLRADLGGQGAGGPRMSAGGDSAWASPRTAMRSSESPLLPYCSLNPGSKDGIPQTQFLKNKDQSTSLRRMLGNFLLK